MSTETENRIVAQLEELCEKFDRLDRTITGGDEPTRGMIVRLDRLEQAKERADRFMGAIAVAALGGLLTGLGSLILKVIQQVKP